MHQNYNSLLSPKKNPPKNQFHFRPSKALPNTAGKPLPCSPSSQKLLRLSKQNLIKEIELFNWRSKTSLPILKIADYAVYPLVQPLPSTPIFSTDASLFTSQQKCREEASIAEIMHAYMASHAEVLEYELRVRSEEVRCTLQDIEMLPMPQLIYLLKEVLIGFEVLIDIFGLFEPSQRMVVVNQRQQWKVWINEDYIASSKRNCTWNEKQFIHAILKAVELHSNHNTQSKHLFNILTETTYSNDCTFIKVLEKINQFVAVNKIFTVNKVLLTSQRIISKDSFQNSCNLADGLAASNVRNIKRDLQKLTSPVFERGTPNMQTMLAGNNRSAANLFDRNTHGLIHSPSYTKLHQYPIHNQTINYNVFSPKYSRKEERDSPYDNWDKVEKNAMQVSKFITKKNIPSLDFSQILHSPNNSFQSRPNFNNKSNANIKQPSIVPNEMKRTTLTNTSPSKNRTDMKQMVQQKAKPVSKVEQPQKRNNRRKYSQQIIQIKSLENITRKEKHGHISNIYNPNDTLKSFSKVHEGVMVATPTPKTIKKQQESPDVKCISSPNNSSSTKEIQQSGEIKSNYIKLKMKDLGGDKPKNNQSVINTYTIANTLEPQAKKDKNMAASYQFQSKDCSSSNSQRSLKKGNAKKKETKWSNKISGLFSDNMSIKHLKESIKIKTKEEEHFEKEYLKDIKLDLLQKFGRKVNHMVEEEDGKYLNAQYKSMQLIEEELQQGKSYLEDEKIEDFPKETRSKHLTMQVNHHPFQLNLKETSLKDHHSEYDDNDLSSEIASSSSSSGDGFNFETEMYVINRPQ